MGENTGFTEFHEFMTSNGFIAQIQLPTRFDVKSCSLIDHMWVHRPARSELETLASASSAVLLKRLGRTDHCSTLLFLDLEVKKSLPPKYILTQKIDDESVSNFRNDLSLENIADKIDRSEDGDPELNYSIIENIVSIAKEKNFPTKKIRFDRHKHKIQPWMSNIITGLARPATLKLTPLHYKSKVAVRREAGARTVVYKKKRLMTPPPHHHHHPPQSYNRLNFFVS